MLEELTDINQIIKATYVQLHLKRCHGGEVPQLVVGRVDTVRGTKDGLSQIGTKTQRMSKNQLGEGWDEETILVRRSSICKGPEVTWCMVTMRN